MKNIILLISLFFVHQAFAFKNVDLKSYGSERLFTFKYLVSYCSDYDCKNTEAPSFEEKTNKKTTALVFKKATRQIRKAYYEKSYEIDSWDLTTEVTKQDLIELIEEDFTGGDGDAPMHYNDTQKVLGIIGKYDAKYSIMGVMSNYMGGTAISEFIIIYIEKLDKVYILERFQYAE